MHKVLMVASEAVPFVKTGGLADVIGALPIALQRQGEDVAVVLPRYQGIEAADLRRVYDDLPVWIGSTAYRLQIYSLVREGVTFYFVHYPPAYFRNGIYNEQGLDYPDNHVRFAILCKAALGIVRYLFRPQIIHCHDWQAGLVGPYLRYLLRHDPTYMGIRLVFTIHNLGYQGIASRAALPEVGLDDSLFRPDLLEFYGNVSLLKAGLVYSDAITTVSRGYAREITTPEYGFGMDGVLRQYQDRLVGILNGVDYGEWSPETDTHIAASFSSADLSGKQLCKADLLASLGLPEHRLDKPVIGIVSRFATQKGFDLIAQIGEELMSEDVTLAVLGSGEPQYEDLFRRLAASHPDRVGLRVAYDNTLAHKIEAGADMFLMPSQYEPCGLNQIYSLRYGTIPIVRATGGLDDTIEAETGFKFQEYSGVALLQAIREALQAYTERPAWVKRMRTAMQKDFSWSASAQEYRALYQRLGEMNLFRGARHQ